MENQPFAFATYKLDSQGRQIFFNDRYSVTYYTDEGAPNTASHVTYGLAIMEAKIYNIKVYDMELKKQVMVSDLRIDPTLYFDRDYVSLFGKKYWKIILKILD